MISSLWATAIVASVVLAEPATRVVPDTVPTIQAAIDASNSGDTVRVKAGVYEETLRLEKGVTLEAEEGARVVVRMPAETGPVLSLSGCPGTTIRGLAFEHTGVPANADHNPEATPVVLVQDSTVEMTGCEVWGSAASGIALEGASEGTIRDCNSHNNVRNGVAASGPEARLVLTGSTMRENTCGLYLYDGATGTVENNEFLNNQFHGIVVDGKGCEPLLKGNTCSGNGENGIRYGDHGAGRAENNTCADNGWHGISVEGKDARPELIGNTCRGNKKYGIWFGDQNLPRARGNDFIQNGEISQWELKRLFADGAWDDLEALAARLLRDMARYESGAWQLHWYYEHLTASCRSMSKADEDAFLTSIGKWRQAYPQSTTPMIVLARAYEDFGWRERGGGYASEVDKDSWLPFHEYLRKGWEILEAAEKLGARDPELYYVKVSIANGAGFTDSSSSMGDMLWRYLAGKEQKPSPLEEAFPKGVALEPTYEALYEIRTWSLLPRWHGSRREILAFATESADNTASLLGDGMYAWIAQNVRHYEGDESFSGYGFSWPRIDKGFRDLESRYSGGYILNAHCLFACMFDDQETARDLFEGIDDRWDSGIWGRKHRFDVWREWATAGGEHPRGKAIEAAVNANSASQVREALSRGAKVNDATEYGETMLALAIREEKDEALQALLEAGADPNYWPEGGTPTILAAMEDPKSTERVRILLEHGADPNLADGDGWTPLLTAIWWDYPQHALLLLEYGADPNKSDPKNDQAPIFFALHKGQKAVVRALLEKGADPNASDQRGATPLSAAVRVGRKDLCVLLVESGADPSLGTPGGWTPIFDAAETGSVELAKFLVEKGARVDVPEEDGWSVFHEAAACGHVAVLDFLLECHPEGFNALTDSKRTLLHQAAKRGRAEMVQHLLDKGHEVNPRDDKGLTPLSLAVAESFEDVSSILRKHGGVE